MNIKKIYKTIKIIKAIKWNVLNIWAENENIFINVVNSYGSKSEEIIYKMEYMELKYTNNILNTFKKELL